MLAKERQDQIVALVNENGSVLVKELSERFSVTEDSIRKDLTLLQKKGLLKKTYGGAVKIQANAHDFYVAQRRDKNLEDKRRIASQALELIQDGDVLFLDISTSNLELARRLIETKKTVTVVTNMVDIMLAFTVPTQVKFTFVAGSFSDGRDGFVGALTNRELQNYRFDKAFMGVVGVDLERNSVTTYSAEDASTKRTVMENCADAYMMLETRKLTAAGNYVYARVDEFTGAVTEKLPAPGVLQKMERCALDCIAFENNKDQ